MNDKTVLATVDAWDVNKGVRLRFDGEEEAGSKYYKTRAYLRVDVGDRVVVTPCSGTYVVDYVVGLPSPSLSKMNKCPTESNATAALCANWINAIITALAKQGVIDKNGW